MTIKNLDKTALKMLRPEIEAALADLSAKFGIVFHVGNASFTDSMATFKLELLTKAPDGAVFNKYADDFKRYAVLENLREDDLGKTFTVRGQVYTITGYNSKAVKMPILATSNGKTFKFQSSVVARLLRPDSMPSAFAGSIKAGV